MVMGIFKQKQPMLNGSTLPRVSKLSDSELSSWFSVGVMEVGLRFDLWKHHDDPMEEVDTAMTALTEMWAEIKARENGRHNN